MVIFIQNGMMWEANYFREIKMSKIEELKHMSEFLNLGLKNGALLVNVLDDERTSFLTPEMRKNGDEKARVELILLLNYLEAILDNMSEIEFNAITDLVAIKLQDSLDEKKAKEESKRILRQKIRDIFGENNKNENGES